MSPNAGQGGELRGLSQWVQLYMGAQINFRDLTPCLTYVWTEPPRLRKSSADAHSLGKRPLPPPHLEREGVGGGGGRALRKLLSFW